MRRLGYWLRVSAAGTICALALLLYFSPQMQAVRSLPDAVYLAPGQTRTLPLLAEHRLSVQGESVAVRASGDESIEDVGGVAIDGIAQGKSDVTVSVYGVPLRRVAVNVAESRIVQPGGLSVGVTLHTKGALVVGSSSVVTPDGTSVNPGREAGLSPGDVILAVDDTEVTDAQELTRLVNQAEGPVKLDVKNGNDRREVEVVPQIDAKDGKLRMGLWVRDGTIGVGTMTFYDPETAGFGALGHAITDIDTRSRLDVSSGEILRATIEDVNKGQRGQPGELKGKFSQENALGSIDANTDYGIYGKLYAPFQNELYPDGVPVAMQSEVHAGPAEILSTVDGTGIRRFSCEIVRVQQQSTPHQRGMVFEITDPELLKATGGIVQGMSGSPILQDGKLIGAVTHVFVNDPTRGYGMFIEWMLDEMARE